MMDFFLNSWCLVQKVWGAGKTNKSFSANMKLTACMGIFHCTVLFLFFDKDLNVSMWDKKSYLHTPQYGFERIVLRELPWDLLWLKNSTFKWCCLILGSASHHCQCEVRSMQFSAFTFHHWIQIPLPVAPGQSLIMTCLHLKASNIFLHLTAYWLKQIQWLQFKLFVNFDATLSCFVSRWNILTWCIIYMNWDGKRFLHTCS